MRLPDIPAQWLITQAKHFAEQQVALAEENAKREAAETEAKAMYTRIKYLIIALICMTALLGVSTVTNVIMTTRGTTKVVEKYRAAWKGTSSARVEVRPIGL